MKRSDEIQLSPKYGVNPSVGLCWICGNENGTIILPGRLPDDKQAPRSAVWDATPCPACADAMQKGIMLIELSREPKTGEHPGTVPRTGWIAAITEEAFLRCFTGGDFEEVKKSRLCYVGPGTLAAIGVPRPDQPTV